MRISDWSSDVCSSDLLVEDVVAPDPRFVGVARGEFTPQGDGTTLVFGAVPQRRRVGIAIGDRQVGPLPARRGVEIERSEESRVGKECVSACRSRWWPYN